jgi:hypothetical protein
LAAKGKGGTPPGVPRSPFPKVAAAREALKAKALEIYEMQMLIIKEALAAQDFKVAADANQFLMEHMPADEDGTRLLGAGVDVRAAETKPTGPTINIGFALGGIPDQKALPAVKVIDVEVKDE